MAYEKLEKEREAYKIFARGANKDYWAHTICDGCYAECGIKIRVVDGCPVSIEGVPESDLGGQGGLCGRGVATLFNYHDPNRVNYPLRRTNPKKGIGEDPKWERISWDEALDTIAEKVIRARKKDPRAIAYGGTPGPGTGSKFGTGFCIIWVLAGSHNYIMGGPGSHCGAAAHHGAALMHAAWDILPDYRYTNFLIRAGGNEGMGGGRLGTISMRQAAAARDRGMRMVVIDPIGYVAAAKAIEWIPILPGTDIAVWLAMANLMVNEIGIFDAEYIRHKTNGSYLLGQDGYILKDRQREQPLLWDETDNKAKTWDDPTLKKPALYGQYSVEGMSCQPAFHVLKEHLKQYTPEWASKISTIPESKIRWLTQELVNEAKIGSTIEIKGVKIPYRPAGVVGYKGQQTHSNGYHQYMSMYLINALLGNQDVAGGIIGSGTVRSYGHPLRQRPRFEPFAGLDGMLTPGQWWTRTPYPPRDVVPDDSQLLMNFQDILAQSTMNPYPYCADFDDIWTRAGRPYEVEVLAQYGGNPLMNCVNTEVAGRFLERIPFTFFITPFHNETTEGYADIILPECHAYESCEPFTSFGFFFNYPNGLDKWSFHVRIPVVEPKYERRDTLNIMFDIAERIGLRSQYNTYLENYFTCKSMKWEEQTCPTDFEIVRPDERIDTIELTERVLNYNFGEDHGLEWFMKHGFITWEKRPEECYWRWFNNARVPIFDETVAKQKEIVRKRAEKIGFNINAEHYTSFFTYFPNCLYTENPSESEYDLIAISHRDPLHTHRFMAGNPLIDEASRSNPYTYNIVMHKGTAKKRGIGEGDLIVVENPWGDRVTGNVKLTALIHERVIGIVGLGTWSRGRKFEPRGINHNQLLRLGARYIDPVVGAVEEAINVKAYRAEVSK